MISDLFLHFRVTQQQAAAEHRSHKYADNKKQ